MAWAPDGCPSTRYFDQGDYAEPESCDLPIEHNADDEPWHLSVWSGDGERARLEWRWDKEILVSRWPPPKDVLPATLARYYADMLVKVIEGENVLFTHLPTQTIPEPEGISVRWRKWPTPNATVLEAQETASTGDADVRDPA